MNTGNLTNVLSSNLCCNNKNRNVEVKILNLFSCPPFAEVTQL